MTRSINTNNQATNLIDIIKGDGTNFSVENGNITIHGNLELDDKINIIIPENITIQGDFHADDTNGIVLPENMKVEGWFCMAHSDIESIPAGIDVDGYLYLHNCENLKEINCLEKFPRQIKHTSKNLIGKGEFIDSFK